jgi:hypothetical protein
VCVCGCTGMGVWMVIKLTMTRREQARAVSMDLKAELHITAAGKARSPIAQC